MNRRRAPKGPTIDLPVPVREIAGNLTLTDTAAVAWYRLKQVPWPFKSISQWEQILQQVTVATAGLAGRRTQWRVTQRPYPIAVWAQGLDEGERTDPVDRDAWLDHLQRTQQHLAGYSLAANEVYVGVEIASRDLIDRIHGAANKGMASDRETRRLKTVLQAVESAMSMPGLSGTAVPNEDLIWLVHQSVGLHAPNAPQVSFGGMDATDMAAFTDGLRFTPDGDLTMVTATHARTGGDPATHWVGVLSIGRMEALTIPQEQGPWLAHAQGLGFRVEVTAHLRYLTGAEARKAVQSKLHLVRDQLKQYATHGLDPLPEVEIVGGVARTLRHDLEEGDRVTSTQVHGVWRLAVAGATREECLERMAALKAHYADMRITLEHPAAQFALYGEFCPGAKPSSSSHTRHMGLDLAAAALPTQDSTLGDDVGDYLGHTTGAAPRPVMFDVHRVLFQGENTGLIPIVAGLGGGKSTLMAKLAHSAVLRGITTTLLDPSGPLARLCAAPDLAGQSVHIDLLSAPDGSLSPWTVIPTPRRDNYATVEEHQEACKEVQRERRLLALDVVRMLLPSGLVADPRTDLVLMTASKSLIGSVATAKASLFELIIALKRSPEHTQHATAIAAYLEDLQDLPMARLIYPRAASGDESRLAMDATLVVLTMAGIVLPNPATDPAQYTISERVALPLLHLAAHLATRRIYSRPMWEPKLVGLDEAFWLAQWPSGRALLQRLGRDNRKWRSAVLVASQTPADILLEGVGNLISQAFVGRLEDEAAQADALRMLRVPVGIGYEQWLGALSPVSPTGDQSTTREFVMRDGAGRVGQMVIDLGNTPTVAAAIAPARAPIAAAPPAAPPRLRSLPVDDRRPSLEADPDRLGWPGSRAVTA